MACGFSFDMEQDYFHWLCERVGVERSDGSYWILMQHLHRRPYYSTIPHDENRAADGLEIRENYLQEIGYLKYDPLGCDCSVLEMLVGLAQNMDFQTDDPYDSTDRSFGTAYWFWDMLDNLGLTCYNDEIYAKLGNERFFESVDGIVDRMLERQYAENGEGGLFPLNRCADDQRNVEIWYQMFAYLADRQFV